MEYFGIALMVFLLAFVIASLKDTFTNKKLKS
jgi:hypothetical protein